MTKVVVLTEEICLDSYSSDEEYGDWSSTNQFSVLGARILKEGEKTYNPAVFELGNVKDGDEVHVLSIVYGSGDSFGSSSGNGEIVMVYKSRALAEQAYSMYDEKSDDYTIKLPFETPTGTRFCDIGNPAAGYFETFESLDLETFTIGKEY